MPQIDEEEFFVQHKTLLFHQQFQWTKLLFRTLTAMKPLILSAFQIVHQLLIITFFYFNIYDTTYVFKIHVFDQTLQMNRPAGPTPADAAVLTVADCLIHMHASITSGVALCPVVITCSDKPVLRFQGVVYLFTMQNKAND